MPLTLTDRDLESISRAATVCASPLDHPHPDAWRAAVNRALRELVGADSAGFMLPGTDGPLLFSEEHDPGQLARFPEMETPRRSDGVDVWQKALDDGVGTIRTIYEGDTPIYHASAYFNEYALPNGAADTLGAMVRLRHAGSRHGDAAGVQLWRAGRRASGQEAFGRRDIQLLQLVYPSLVAGITLAQQWQSLRGELLEAVDALGQPVLVCDATAAPIHESAGLSSVLAAEADASGLRARLADLATAFGRRLALAGPAIAAGPAPALPIVAGGVTYHAQAVPGPRLAAHDRHSILVILTPLAGSLPAAGELQRRFGLTPSESRVALLLARGASNAGVADALSVRPSTARRHTERVLQKLGISSRAAVASRIAGSM